MIFENEGSLFSKRKNKRVVVVGCNVKNCRKHLGGYAFTETVGGWVKFNNLGCGGERNDVT